MTQVQYFNGIRFALTKGSKYFCNAAKRITMHRYVWEYHNGPIPNGYDIHHKDGNRLNNDITNLECIKSKEHKQLHGRNLSEADRQKRRDNINANVRPKAVEWHKSDEGKKWHKQQAKTRKDPRVEIINVCQQCGKTFITIGTKPTKFCSGACSQQHRRDSKTDKVEKVCIVCGNVFLTNKYRPAKTCSKTCANKIWDHNRRGN